MANSPVVSVVMVVLDPDPRYLAQAVESVLSQTFRDLELVIVEDPAERSARDTLANYRDERIRHYCNSARTSLMRQRNETLRQARGEFIAVLDMDDICEPHRLETQLDFMRANPEVTVLGSQITIIDPQSVPVGSRRYPLDHEAIVRCLPSFNPIAFSSVLFRRETVLAAGGHQYDKNPDVELVDDYGLFSRLALRGMRLANHPEALIRYRIHPQATKFNKLRASIRGTLEVKRRYWLDHMNLREKIRMNLERALLLLPPKLVYKLFVASQYKSKNPPPQNGDSNC